MQRGKQQEPLDPDPLGPPGRSHIKPSRFHWWTDAVEQAVRQARPEAFRDRCKSQSSKTDAEGQAARPIGFGASRTPCPISHRILSISMVDRCSRASGETGRGARGRARRARPRAPGSISRPMQERCRGASSKTFSQQAGQHLVLLRGGLVFVLCFAKHHVWGRRWYHQAVFDGLY